MNSDKAVFLLHERTDGNTRPSNQTQGTSLNEYMFSVATLVYIAVKLSVRLFPGLTEHIGRVALYEIHRS
jgi:hypothetical protein